MKIVPFSNDSFIVQGSISGHIVVKDGRRSTISVYSKKAARRLARTMNEISTDSIKAEHGVWTAVPADIRPMRDPQTLRPTFPQG